MQWEMSKITSFLYVSIRINSIAKTKRCSGRFSDSSPLLSQPVSCCTSFLVRQVVVGTCVAKFRGSEQDVTFEGEHFLLLLSHFRHFLCPFVASYPFHPCSRRRLSPRAAGVCLWRHWPLGQLPDGRLATSCRCTPGSVINTELFLLPLILRELFCYRSHLLGIFAFYGQMNKKHGKTLAFYNIRT
jgi:hypothetical protein